MDSTDLTWEPRSNGKAGIQIGDDVGDNDLLISLSDLEDLEAVHDQGSVRVRQVARERGLTVTPTRSERDAARSVNSKYQILCERGNGDSALVPLPKGRHREPDVVGHHLDEGSDVSELPCAYVTIEQILHAGVGYSHQRPAAKTGRLAGPEQQTVDTRRGYLKGFGHLCLVEANDIMQEQARPLARGEPLQGSDEGEGDVLAPHYLVLRVCTWSGADNGLDPLDVSIGSTRHLVGTAWRPQAHGINPPLPRPQHIKAHVGGNSI